MTGGEAALYTVIISAVVGLISGWLVQKKGYSFVNYFVTGFIASCGILAIIYKLISEYL